MTVKLIPNLPKDERAVVEKVERMIWRDDIYGADFQELESKFCELLAKWEETEAKVYISELGSLRNGGFFINFYFHKSEATIRRTYEFWLKKPESASGHEGAL